MSPIRLSRKARADLDEIWLYVAQQQSLEAADGLIDSIAERFSLLASTPGMGRRRDEIASGMRSFPVGNYVIYYRRTRGGLRISRVLHGARDAGRFFG